MNYERIIAKMKSMQDSGKNMPLTKEEMDEIPPGFFVARAAIPLEDGSAIVQPNRKQRRQQKKDKKKTPKK
jgi:hypothetical protein